MICKHCSKDLKNDKYLEVYDMCKNCWKTIKLMREELEKEVTHEQL